MTDSVIIYRSLGEQVSDQYFWGDGNAFPLMAALFAVVMTAVVISQLAPSFSEKHPNIFLVLSGIVGVFVYNILQI